MDTRYKTVSNTIARKQLQYADAMGMSGEELLRSVGISPEELQRENGRIEAHKHIRITKLFAHQPIPYERFISGGLDPLFDDYPLLAAVCANCPTLRTALTTFMQFRGIIGELDFLHFYEAHHTARFEFISEGMPPTFDKGARANLLNIAKIARHYSLGVRLPMHCHLRGPAPADASVMEEFLEGKVLYNMDSNILEFSTAQFDVPYPQFNAVLHRVFSQKLTQELAAIQTHGAFSSKVELAIRGIFTAENSNPTGDAVLKNVCAQMNTTRWTLWRKLQQEGQTYQDIVLKVRTQVARSYLERPGMSLGAISHHLGFSSQSAFSRFFKDQEGIAPTQYRHRILGRE
nr:helix-turn-helix domain-containing protein [uncultured Albidiferax sp.]